MNPSSPASENPTGPSGATTVLLCSAAFVIIVAGMKAASSILVPCFLAVFLAVISGPPLAWLKNRGIPTFPALLIIFAGLVVCGTGVGAVITGAIRDFSAKNEEYQTRVSEIRDDLFALVERVLPSDDASDADPVDSEVRPATGAKPISLRERIRSVDLGVVFSFLQRFLGELSGMLGNALFIGLTVMFILAEASSFPRKIRSAFSRSSEVEAALGRFTSSINRYMAMKTLMSLLTGLVIGVWLDVLGVDFAFLWGLLAFLLNFIPNLGSILAAVPAVLVAWIHPGGTTALLAAGGYVVANFAIGNFVEPRVMGKGLDLSTLVVFISLVFWGWVFGPVGMLLSVPLTMTAKIALEASDDTRWLAVLMGSGGDAVDPAESVEKVVS